MITMMTFEPYWHLTFDIQHWFDIWHLAFVWYLTFDLWHLTFDICHWTFDIGHWIFVVWHLTFKVAERLTLWKEKVGGTRERRSLKGQGLLRKEGPLTYAIFLRFTRFLKGFHRAFYKNHPALGELYALRKLWGILLQSPKASQPLPPWHIIT